ncbi:MAG: PH domain-containing protein [Bacillota bacterium]|jgi:membrane protein YdbS with pleckstrin-like domain|nr:PH domain-containing protein [Bacillota bacterium]HHU43889.1 PH domain-containing protein [Clostridiales bacterium]
MGVITEKRLTRNALKCWYLRWMLAFILLLSFELVTISISNNLLYGIYLTLVKALALSIPAVFLIIVIIVPYFRYRGFMYSLTKDRITIHRGVITRKKDTLNINKIQHIELSAYPFERIFKLATLKIYTAGSEHILPSIELKDAKKIQELANRGES